MSIDLDLQGNGASPPKYPEGEDTLRGLVELWIEKIRRAKDYKKDVFQRDADEAMRFYHPGKDRYDFVYSGEGDSGREDRWLGSDPAEPPIKMTLNKVAEIVAIYGPMLYQKNPVRQVEPRQPAQIDPSVIPDPTMLQYLGQLEQQRTKNDTLKSALLSAYLNWTPNHLGLREESLRGIDEALVKGRGCLWIGTYHPPGTNTAMVGSFYDTVDHLQIDPDAESLNSAWWIEREITQPVWQAERRFGLKPGTLKASAESVNRQSEIDSERRHYDRQRGVSSDLITYHEIYSKMGVGGRLSGADKGRDSDLLPGDLTNFARTLDPLVGDHVFLVIAKGTPYPLNLPPEIQELPITGTGGPDDGGVVIKERLSWPIPLHDFGLWPVSVLDFREVPRCAWPMSIVTPALGELRFLCWAYSFVAGKIKSTLRDIVAILKEMADQFKLTVLEGADLAVVEIDTNNRNIHECVQVLQFPQMNADIWRIIQAVEANFDKRVGLNEAMYGGQGTQTRSATQAQQTQQQLNIRPQDMAERVENWMTEAARKEAIAARMLLAPKDVLPMLGLASAALWGTFLSTRDVGVIRELEYRIEAGSTRKPNRDRDQQNADQSFQILGPILTQFASATGQLGPLNALISYWCKSRDVPPGPFMLPPPPPPPPPPAGGAAPAAAGGPPPPPAGGPPPPR
jgi:hypothetical protein